MPLVPPNLDDRRFDDLVDEALARIRQCCPQWSDLSVGDPGRTMLEAFAYITDVLLYRVNRIPNKAYIEFLRLIGVQLQSPSAASVMLTFSLSLARDSDLEIPRGTRVTAQRSGEDEPPVFVTTETATVVAGSTQVDIRALHCDFVEGEWVGKGSGMPGQVVTVSQPPIIAPSGEDTDLVVGVEVGEDEKLESDASAVRFDDKTYRIWREVENFSNLEGNQYVFKADRLQGVIMFAPSLRIQQRDDEVPQALAAVPSLHKNLRVWYRRGGGMSGNIQAGELNVLKDQIPGVSVSNAAAATGGGSAENLENALLRGPQQLHSLHRAVTARDFELVAKRASRAVNRAYAYTKAAHWSYAKEGTVEVLIVPALNVSAATAVTEKMLREQQSRSTLDQVQVELNKRKPLGTQCLVNWAKYKTVNVITQIRVLREEDPVAVRERVMQRLWQTINPLADLPSNTGWAFGRQITVWDIYKLLGDEPGVSSVDDVSLEVDLVPADGVRALCNDAFQSSTWYAGAGKQLFRSTNDSEGWEFLRNFPDQEVIKIKSFPREASTQRRAGLLAVATRRSGAGGSSVYLSHDCGEIWEPALNLTFAIEDMAWVERDRVPVLLLATESGLFELSPQQGADPKKITIAANKADLGFYAVAVSSDIWGGTTVAVAARGNEGVYLSIEAGKPESFKAIGLNRELIRTLSFQRYGPQRYLWAGSHVVGSEAGNGCYRWLLTGLEDNPEGWVQFQAGWGQSGNCNEIVFQGSVALAASDRMGVLRLDIAKTTSAWSLPDVNCKLPLQPKLDLGRLLPVRAVAASEDWLLAGGEQGVYRSKDQGQLYEIVSTKSFPKQVTLPRTWLFCSGEHNVEVKTVEGS